ncbi:MAG TPA: glycosyltransferase family 2 protein [Candidatus Accumulibacter phosphatis]|nr:MAG: putative glycosyltransferase EpsE [Candidatus Accumulibacter sp. SK-11]HRL74618.1 glycosyltransferase family 2 protein [Candidatus Accumulibacter phosphatis]HRQ96536.1 glycosyltransferase family 2 protein [Candidatus Accumulibacter phosphatis]
MSADVDVLIPAYNCARFLEAAVDSTLAGNSCRSRVVIVDDGSRDDTVACAKRLAIQHRNIEIVENERNMGIITSLNRGLAACTAPFVARMDGDDICLPGRLDAQLAAMKRESAAVCGTSMDFFGAKSGRWLCPPDYAYRATLLFRPAFGHSTAMLDRQWLAARLLDYPAHLYCEDYALWIVMELVGARATLLQTSWLRYRVHAQSTSSSNSRRQIVNACETSFGLWEKLGMVPSPQIRRTLVACHSDSPPLLNDLQEALVAMHRLLSPALDSLWARAEFVRFCAVFLIVHPARLNRRQIAAFLGRLEGGGLLSYAWRRFVLDDRY